jgi:hypothetical protein
MFTRVEKEMARASLAMGSIGERQSKLSVSSGWPRRKRGHTKKLLSLLIILAVVFSLVPIHITFAATDGVLDGWEARTDELVNATMYIDSVGHVDTKSLAISLRPNPNIEQWRAAFWRAQRWTWDLDDSGCPLKRGQSYRFRAWYQTRSAKLRFWSAFWAGNWSWMEGGHVEVVVRSASPDVWEQSPWVIFTVPLGAKYAAVEMVMALMDIDPGAVEGFARASDFELYQEAPDRSIDPPSDGLWRPYSDGSVWNTKIPENPDIHWDSYRMIEWLKNLPYTDGGHFDINIYTWTNPIYNAYADTPRVTVYKYDGSVYHTNVPMPTDAQADPMQDRSMIIIDWDNKVEWDFWDVTFNVRLPNKWVAGACIPWDLYGSGVHPDGVWGAGGSSAPGLAGMIRPEEIEAGVIRHALRFACYTPKKGWKVYPPAATTDGQDVDPHAIPTGARLQLDPSLNIDEIEGLSEAGKIIAKCMQDYGMILCDCAGGLPFYAESPLGREEDPWPALSFNDNSAKPIPPNFRVIDYAVFGGVEEPFIDR